MKVVIKRSIETDPSVSDKAWSKNLAGFVIEVNPTPVMRFGELTYDLINAGVNDRYIQAKHVAKAVDARCTHCGGTRVFEVKD